MAEQIKSYQRFLTKLRKSRTNLDPVSLLHKLTREHRFIYPSDVRRYCDEHGYVVRYYKRRIYICSGYSRHSVTEKQAQAWYKKFHKAKEKSYLYGTQPIGISRYFESNRLWVDGKLSNLYMGFGCKKVSIREIERIAKQRRWKKK